MNLKIIFAALIAASISFSINSMELIQNQNSASTNNLPTDIINLILCKLVNNRSNQGIMDLLAFAMTNKRHYKIAKNLLENNLGLASLYSDYIISRSDALIDLNIT